jgi:hypothetical protein
MVDQISHDTGLSEMTGAWGILLLCCQIAHWTTRFVEDNWYSTMCLSSEADPTSLPRQDHFDKIN